MKKIFAFLVFILFTITLSQAQVDGKWQIGNQAGFAVYSADAKQNSIFREQSSNGISQLRSSAFQWRIGLAIERQLNHSLFLNSGLGYSELQTITKIPGGLFSKKRFYLLISENDQQLVYASISKVYTYKSYLSVPLELRYEFMQRRKTAFYIKGGIIADFAVSSSITKLNTVDNLINTDSNTLDKYFKNANDIFLNSYGAAGIRIGKLHKRVNGRIEVGLPVALTGNVGNYRVGAGFMMSGSLYYSIEKFKN